MIMRKFGKKMGMRVIVIICLFAMIMAAVWYHIPVTRNVSMPVCALDGESFQMEARFTFYRSFFQQTYVRGKIICGDTVYTDIYNKIESGGFELDSDTDWWDSFLAKYGKKAICFPEFVNEELSVDHLEVYNDFIITFNPRGGFDIQTVELAISKEDVSEGERISKFFYGPAVTTEEAQAVYDTHYK